jgi:hypothetical protein
MSSFLSPEVLDGDPSRLPVEVEVYINPDGSVTFADLEAAMLPVAAALNPDQPLACDAPLPQDIDVPRTT